MKNVMHILYAYLTYLHTLFHSNEYQMYDTNARMDHDFLLDVTT